MATKNIVPRANGEGQIGTTTKGWKGLFSTDVTTSSASTGGVLQLAANDGAVMASGHRLGVIYFSGAEDASSTMTIGARIEAVTDAIWSASENGAELLFYTTDGNAVQSEVLKLDATKNATFAGDIQVGGGDVFGPTDGDFNIASDGNMTFNIDNDDDESSQSFTFKNDTTDCLSISEAGVLAAAGAIGGVNYRTIWVDAGSMVPASTNGALAGTEEMHATNFTTLDYFVFDKGTEQYADFKMVMPEQYNYDTIKVKFYWKPADAEASVSVIWGVKAYAATDSDALTGASGVWGTAVTIEDASLNTDDDLHISPTTADMTIAGTPAEGKLVFFRVYRKAADGTDDYDDDAHLLGVNIQYQETATASASW